MASIAVTDHLPFYWLPAHAHDPSLAMETQELPRYVESVLALKARYAGRIDVLLGCETDYIPGHEATLATILAEYPFDLVLGSVHWLDGWCLDAPSSLPRYRLGQEEVDGIWGDYAEALLGAVRSGLFDVFCHLDLPKKFGFRPSRPFAGRQGEIVAAIAASGCTVEHSSAGRRRPVREDYPSPALLGELARAGVPFVLSSDAHEPGEVGFVFRELLGQLEMAGVTELTHFRARFQSRSAFRNA